MKWFGCSLNDLIVVLM